MVSVVDWGYAGWWFNPAPGHQLRSKAVESRRGEPLKCSSSGHYCLQRRFGACSGLSDPKLEQISLASNQAPRHQHLTESYRNSRTLIHRTVFREVSNFSKYCSHHMLLIVHVLPPLYWRWTIGHISVEAINGITKLLLWHSIKTFGGTHKFHLPLIQWAAVTRNGGGCQDSGTSNYL